jgi:hypothetical protein
VKEVSSWVSNGEAKHHSGGEVSEHYIWVPSRSITFKGDAEGACIYICRRSGDGRVLLMVKCMSYL